VNGKSKGIVAEQTHLQVLRLVKIFWAMHLFIY
jgi:hypothetical protein